MRANGLRGGYGFGSLFTGRSGEVLIAFLSVGLLAVAGLSLEFLSRSDAIGLIGVLLALLFGALALRSGIAQQERLIEVLQTASSHEKSLVELSERVETEMSRAVRRVTDALQTVYIGSSPDFFPQVTGLITRATQSLTILCDHPTYHMFSNGPRL
jgi:hypothetical protein